jgi:hypothetical protein
MGTRLIFVQCNFGVEEQAGSVQYNFGVEQYSFGVKDQD